MSRINRSGAQVYAACVPHVPLLSTLDRGSNPDLWQAYDARVREFRAFDPELVIVFGGDHYSGMHLKLMPTFAIGHIANGVPDCGGHPGPLDVPMPLSEACTRVLVEQGFDLAQSYALEVDHGFTNVIHNFLGTLDARPVLPVFINAMCDPKPSFQRCREFGAAIGRYAATLGKRVAFLGSGGLSHQTDSIFPQYHTAHDEAQRDYLVHGGGVGPVTRQRWYDDMFPRMEELGRQLVSGEFKAPWINKHWDERFIAAFTSGDLTQFDQWRCSDVTAEAGYGGGEIRQWIAAAAAAQAAGLPQLRLDYYSDQTSLAVGAAIAHGLCTE